MGAGSDEPHRAHPARLRVARHTDRLEQVVAFYRDRVGLPERGRFADHDGYDGVFLDVPGSAAELELTSGGSHPAPAPHPDSLLVLYLETREEIDAIAARIDQPPLVPANPYWEANGVTFADPDGFQIVLAMID